MKALVEQGVDGFVPVFQLLLNEAMKVERSEHLHAQPYERTAERQGQANGFKAKNLLTRSGPLELSVPGMSHLCSIGAARWPWLRVKAIWLDLITRLFSGPRLLQLAIVLGQEGSLLHAILH